MNPRSALVLSLFSALAMAQTAPPAPVPVAPAAGVSLVQPIALQWNPVAPPSGSIGSYSWEIGTTSAFATIIAAGFTNVSDLPAPTRDNVSGLPNGTYFWHVKATAIVGGAVFALDSPWSPTITFAVTGLGAAPAAPQILAPATGASFHPLEFFDIRWSAVPGAHH